MAKASQNDAVCVSSRRRLISFNPTATKGPTSAKPDASGNNSGHICWPDARRAIARPTSG